MGYHKNAYLDKAVVFFDFDNTITDFDILDDIIEKYSISEEWRDIEIAWARRLIGSGESLTRQLALLRLTKKDLLKYLAKIKISPYFKKIIDYFKNHKIKFFILSDNFAFIIEKILEVNGIKGVKVFSNRLGFNKDRLIPGFPLINKRCHYCGHCKTKHLLEFKLRNKIIVYIGDGLSDMCPAKEADVVFAKGSLIKKLKEKQIDCFKFSNLKELYRLLRGS